MAKTAADTSKVDLSEFSSQQVEQPRDADLSEFSAEGVIAPSTVAGQPVDDVGVLDQFLNGVKNSSTGLIFQEEMPPPVEGIAGVAGKMLGDLPLNIAGGAIGTAGGAPTGFGAIATGAGAALALPTAIETVLRQKLAYGDTKSVSDFFDRFFETLKESAKSYGVGVATGGAGKIALYGFKTAAEITTAATTSSLVEGLVPTSKDYLNAAAQIVGMKAAGRVVGKLKEHYDKTGEIPVEAAQKIKDLIDEANQRGEKKTAEQALDELAAQNKQNIKNEVRAAKNEGTSNELNAQPLAPKVDLGEFFERKPSAPPRIDPQFAREEIDKLSTEAEKMQAVPEATPLEMQSQDASPGARIVSEINSKIDGAKTEPAAVSAEQVAATKRSKVEKLWLLTRKLMSPERAALSRSERRKGIIVDLDNPRAQDMVSNVTGGELYFHQTLAQNAVALHNTNAGLTKGERLLIRPMIDLIYKGPEFSQRGKAIHPEVWEAAKARIDMFNAAKTDIRKYMRERLKRNLSPLQQKAFDEMLAAKPGEGEPASRIDVARRKNIMNKYGFDEKTQRQLSALYGKYRGVDFWGIKDFVTNIELGAYKVVDKDGSVRAIRKTKKLAEQAYNELVKEHPGQFKSFKESMETEFFKTTNPLVKRKGVLKGETDIDDAMLSYIASVYKRIIFDPIDYKIRRAYKERPQDFPEQTRGLINQTLKDARGTYSAGEKIFDQIAISLGKEPGGYGRFISDSKRLTGNLALGYRPGAFLSNIAGGYGKIWVKNSIPKMAEAGRWMKTAEGKKFLLEEENIGSLGVNVFVDAAGKVQTTQPWYDPLKLFSYPEPHIRKLNLATAYLDGVKQGMSDGAAREYARRALRLTNFSYNVAALPEIMRSPEARLITQFKTYLVKELEFMHTLTPKEWGKYLTLMGSLGGPRALLLMVQSIPVLGAMGFLDDIAEGINDHLLARGIPGVAGPGGKGFDFSPSIALQIPNEPGDFAGLFLNNAIKLYSDVISPALKGSTAGTVDKYNDWVTSLSPLLGRWNELWNVNKNGGWILNNRGERMYKITTDWDKALLGASLTPTEVSKARVVNRILQKEEDVAIENRRATMRKVLRSLNTVDDIDEDMRKSFMEALSRGELPEQYFFESYGLWNAEGKIPKNVKEDIINYGLTPEAIKSAVGMSRLDARQRLIRRMALRDRLRAFRRSE